MTLLSNCNKDLCCSFFETLSMQKLNFFKNEFKNMRKKKAKININKKIIILFYLVREILDLLYEYKHRPNIVQKIIAFQFVKKLPLVILV